MNQRSVVIKFFAPVIEGTINALMGAIDNAMMHGVKEITILISSPGGSVYHGLSAYNYLKGLPITINTHNFGSVDSIGVVLYCAGSKRYSSPQARFLMHGVSANFERCTLEEIHLEETLKGLKIDLENIAKVISVNTGKSDEEVKKAMLQRTTINPEQAQEWGLVHEIKTNLFPEGTQIISIQYQTPPPPLPQS